MKTLIYIALAAGAVYAASIIVPDELKNRLLAAVGLSNFSLTETIFNTAREAKDAVSDKIIPKSPAERRAELIARLEQTINEIKEAQEKYGDQTPPPAVQQKTTEVIEESQELITELKQENAKSKEGAVSSFVRATSEAISNIAGTNKQEVCEVKK